MGYDFEDAGDAFYAEGGVLKPLRDNHNPSPGVHAVDVGPLRELGRLGAALRDSLAPVVDGMHDAQSVHRLDQERVALEQALARNAVAREQVARAREWRLKMGEDVFEDGDVVRWTKRFFDEVGILGERTYTYAALKAGGSWWPTGKRHSSGGIGWITLLRYMMERGEVTEVVRMRRGRSLV